MSAAMERRPWSLSWSRPWSQERLASGSTSAPMPRPANPVAQGRGPKNLEKWNPITKMPLALESWRSFGQKSPGLWTPSAGGRDQRRRASRARAFYMFPRGRASAAEKSLLAAPARDTKTPRGRARERRAGRARALENADPAARARLRTPARPRPCALQSPRGRAGVPEGGGPRAPAHLRTLGAAAPARLKTSTRPRPRVLQTAAGRADARDKTPGAGALGKRARRPPAPAGRPRGRAPPPARRGAAPRATKIAKK